MIPENIKSLSSYASKLSFFIDKYNIHIDIYFYVIIYKSFDKFSKINEFNEKNYKIKSMWRKKLRK